MNTQDRIRQIKICQILVKGRPSNPNQKGFWDDDWYSYYKEMSRQLMYKQKTEDTGLMKKNYIELGFVTRSYKRITKKTLENHISKID